MHRIAFAASQEQDSPEAANSQAAARAEEQWSKSDAWGRQIFNLNDEDLAVTRRGYVIPEEHAWARDEKDRLLKDKAWNERFKAGDRDAVNHWGRVTSRLRCRPVPFDQWPAHEQQKWHDRQKARG